LYHSVPIRLNLYFFKQKRKQNTKSKKTKKQKTNTSFSPSGSEEDEMETTIFEALLAAIMTHTWVTLTTRGKNEPGNI